MEEGKARREPSFWWVLFVVLGFVAVGFPLSSWDGPFDPDKVGTLGEWAAAIATAAAVAIALWTVTHERALRADEREHEEEKRRLEASEAMAAGVVMTSEVEDYYGNPRGCCEVWVNVFSSDPLRVVNLAVDWGAGRAAQETHVDVARSYRPIEGEPSKGLMTASHIDPGANGWSWTFEADAFVNRPWVWMTWMDRWGYIWKLELGGRPTRLFNMDDAVERGREEPHPQSSAST